MWLLNLLKILTLDGKEKFDTKSVIHVTVICWVDLEFFLVIFPWCIPSVKFLPIKLPRGIFSIRKSVSVATRVLLGTPAYIATVYLSGTEEPSPWLWALLVKSLKFKASRSAKNAFSNLA